MLQYSFPSHFLICYFNLGKCVSNTLKSTNQTKSCYKAYILCKIFRRQNRQRSSSTYNLLDVLTVNNVYLFHAIKFTHLWHKGLLPIPFQEFFQYASNVHNYNTRYATKQNLHKPKVHNNSDKQTIAFTATLLGHYPHRSKRSQRLQLFQRIKTFFTV